MPGSANYLLRPPVPDDAPGYVDAVLESIPALAPWMPWAHEEYSMAEALSWIGWCRQGWEERSRFAFSVFDAGSGAFVGGCGLNQINDVHRFCNLGYWVRQSFQRRGVATEAIRALSAFAFTELSMGRVEITVAVGNAASLGAARKAGAVHEGVARNRLKQGDRFIDAHMLSLVPPAHAQGDPENAVQPRAPAPRG